MSQQAGDRRSIIPELYNSPTRSQHSMSTFCFRVYNLGFVLGLNERLSNLDNKQIRTIGNELVQDILIMSGYIYNLVKTIQ